MDTDTVGKPKACLLDRDGTLARIDRRLVEGDRPDWGAFNAAIPFDSPVPAIVNLSRSIAADIAVIVLTGRSEDFRWSMTGWLHKHGVRYDLLLMRASKDLRADEHVKADLYRTCIEPVFDVLFAVDDRPSVCEGWKRLGVPLIQVAQPEDIIPAFSGLGVDISGPVE